MDDNRLEMEAVLAMCISYPAGWVTSPSHAAGSAMSYRARATTGPTDDTP